MNIDDLRKILKKYWSQYGYDTFCGIKIWSPNCQIRIVEKKNDNDQSNLEMLLENHDKSNKLRQWRSQNQNFDLKYGMQEMSMYYMSDLYWYLDTWALS